MAETPAMNNQRNERTGGFMDGDAAERFALRVQQDGSLRIEIGHAFTEADIPVLVAAQNELSRLIPAQRAPLRAITSP